MSECSRFYFQKFQKWLTIHLPMQGTLVQSLVWENFTRWGATKPVYCQLLSPWVWSLCSWTGEAIANRSLHITRKSSCPPAQSPPKAWAAPKTSTEKKRQNPKTHTERNKNVSRLLLFFNYPFYFILAAAQAFSSCGEQVEWLWLVVPRACAL